jgi:hypothetical protein
VVGGLTAGAVYFSGVLPEAESGADLPKPSTDDENALPTPSLSPTASPSPRATASPSPSEVAETTKPTPTRSAKPRREGAIRLRAGAGTVSTYEQVTLSGRYPGANGTTLEVQRREAGSWAPFPTSATVDGGAFSTYVASGQPGPNRFRVVDPSTGEASNVVVFSVS